MSDQHVIPPFGHRDDYSLPAMSSCTALEGRSRSIGSGEVSDTLDYQNDQLISDNPMIWTFKVLPVKGKMVVIVEGRPTTIITSIALKRRRLPEKRNILPNRAARGRININNNDNDDDDYGDNNYNNNNPQGASVQKTVWTV